MRLIARHVILIVFGILFLYIKRNQKRKTISKETLTLNSLETYSTQLSLKTLHQKSPESTYVLSYSLFGSNWDRYGSAVETNAIAASQSNLYKNWTVRVYHDGKMFNKELQNVYKKKHKNLFFYDANFLSEFGNVSHINAMAWRYLAVGDHNVNVMCSRDIDSLLLPREEDAVREWLNSNKLIHVMRDHPLHGVHFLAGTWCFRNNKKPYLGDTIAKFVIEKSKRRTIDAEAPRGDCQDILGKYLWPLISDDVMQHDAYTCSKFNGSIPFPSKRENKYSFIGKIAKLPDSEVNLPPCPLKCRPKQHQDWEYC